MEPGRIAELLEPFVNVSGESLKHCHPEPGRRRSEEPAFLSTIQLHAISGYIDLLLRWNARINLTAIRDPSEIVTRHFGESLFLARHLFAAGGGVGSVADLGSGAGFPGIPMKLWAPGITLTVIESNQKKAAFLREVVRTLALTDVKVLNVRAETLPAGSFDVVTFRAVERFGGVLPVAARLVAPWGRLAVLISEPQADLVRSALPNFGWEEIVSVPQSNSRVLLVGRRNRVE